MHVSPGLKASCSHLGVSRCSGNNQSAYAEVGVTQISKAAAAAGVTYVSPGAVGVIGA